MVSNIGYDKTRKQVKAVIEKQLVIRVFCKERMSEDDILFFVQCNTEITNACLERSTYFRRKTTYS